MMIQHLKVILSIAAITILLGCSPGPDPLEQARQLNGTPAKQPQAVSAKSQTTDSAGSDDPEQFDNVVSSSKDNAYVSFAAIGVKLIRPHGFDDAETFHGFQQQNTCLLYTSPSPRD